MSVPSRISLYTYKEGLLSRLAHDLRLTVQRFSIELDQGRVTARFDPRSLHVDGVVSNGDLHEDVLSERDRKQIGATIIDDVLRCGAHPEIQFEGDVTHSETFRFDVRGQLRLTGQTVMIEAALTLGDRVRGDLELKPTRWGIAPFKAMGGALKVQDRVRVVIDLPVEDHGVTATGWNATKYRWSST